MDVGLADPGSGSCCLFKATVAATACYCCCYEIQSVCECVSVCCVSVRYIHDGLERSKLESSQLIWMDCSAKSNGRETNQSLGPSMRASACCID